MSADSTAKRLASFVAVFCIACAGLLLELLQTRILSALYINHVVYLTVTVALLGFGISGALVSIMKERIRNPLGSAAIALGAFAVLTPVCVNLASHSTVLLLEESLVVKLLLCYGVLTLPFICAGMALSLLLMSCGPDVQRLYFVDLVASAAGAIGFALLLSPLGAEPLVWSTSVLSLIGFLALGFVAGVPMWRLAMPVLLLLVMTRVHAGRLVNEQPDWHKDGGLNTLIRNPDFQVEATVWTPIARIDVMSGSEYVVPAPSLPAPLPYKRLAQDRSAFTMLPSPELVDYTLGQGKNGRPIMCPSVGYLVRPAPEDVLIIGVGGGIDVVNAQAFGARRITGVEINQATLDLVTSRYRDDARWPAWPNVELICTDGRNFVARGDRQFDVIVMSGIDTFSALSTGAYVLSENYLYTVEAMEDYLRSLKPGGVMVIFRWLFPHPRESLRLVNLYCEAAHRLGWPDQSRRMLMVATDFDWDFRWGATVIKNGDFTPEEVGRVVEQVKSQREPPGLYYGPLAAVHVPPVFPPKEQQALEDELFLEDAEYLAQARHVFKTLLQCKEPAERRQFERDYFYNIEPVYDDRPFFFEYHKIWEPFRAETANGFGLRGVAVHYTLYLLFAVAGLICLVAILAPLYFFHRDGLKVEGTRSLVGFFSSLGVGFMFIELGVIQHLAIYLGHPMYSLTAVLGGLLLFTGLGSYLASRSSLGTESLLRVGMIGTAVATVAWVVGIKFLMETTRGLPDVGRIGITLATLLPLGLLMGIPFATGLRQVGARDARFIPWAWGINGITSVMASILAIILAMRIGFQMVLVFGAVTYLAGYIAARSYLRAGAAVAAAVETIPAKVGAGV